jgi:hypothetical protein
LISYLADHKVPIAHVNGVGDMDEINQNIMQAVATNVVT